mmetsp:Transcript_15310/g.41957  ORF Transcript_15310/g.41957 Transcript_15310/m.41957 type:complete len:306 (-) Transcript_15310:99-1016(-)
MPVGTLKKFFADKGYGFITSDDGSGDLFAHKNAFVGSEDDIRDGAKVSYESKLDDRSGKPRASTWSVDGPGVGASNGCGGYGASQTGQRASTSSAGTGQLKKFFADKGYGFITADDGSGDIFAPVRTFTGVDSDIQEGMKVNYDAGTDNNTGKPRASSWSAAGGGGGYGGAADGAYGMQGYGGMPGYGAAAYGAMPMPGMGGDRFSPYGAAPAAGYGSMPGYGGPALPVGWEQVVDPSSGKTYYCNRATGESSWTPPQAPAPAPAPAAAPAPTQLPEGWEQATDPASGRPYYFNRSTNATSWTPP